MKEATIYDIAKALNLSPSTVSRGLKNHPAINAETKGKITEKAKELNYQHNTFASNLRRKSTKTIGVVIPRFDSYFMSTVIAGMELEANKSGYNLIISQSQESVKKEIDCINTLFHSRVDGVLLSHAVDVDNIRHLKILQDKNIPIIVFDRAMSMSSFASIEIDNLRAGYEATEHLISKGCKRIVHFGGGADCDLYKDRFQGYRLALEKHGVAYDSNLVYHNSFTEENSLNSAEDILKMDHKPDGIFIANDTSAAIIMNHLIKNGIKVPEDIAIIGFNNDPISKLVTPSLSTVNYPGVEMGRMAAFTLINILSNNAKNSLNKILLNYEVIERNSTCINN